MSSSSSSNGGPTELPEIIERYQRAHDAGDIDAALATFGPTAMVVDDGRTASGPEQIREWLARSATEFAYVRTPLDASSNGEDEWLVVSNLRGDFPGGTVDLRYRFTLSDQLIQELVIAP